MTYRALSILASVLLLTFAAACGGAPATGAAAKRDPLAPTTLYPLVAGAAWSYDVDTGQELPTLAITKVTNILGSRVEVSSGSEPVAYEVSEEGIFRPGSKTWLLKAPIAVGANWPSSSGMTATVTSITEVVDVPAGHFTACVRVEERGGDRGQVVTTVYCPEVGPVALDSQMNLTVAAENAHVAAKLRGYTLSANP